MSDNVVELRSKDDRLLWVCDCGCTTFRAFADGYLECASCEVIAPGNVPRWRESLPDPTSDVEPLSEDNFRVIPLDSARTFFKRQENKSIAVALVVFEDGTVSTFSHKPKFPERLEEHLMTGVNQVLGK